MIRENKNEVDLARRLVVCIAEELDGIARELTQNRLKAFPGEHLRIDYASLPVMVRIGITADLIELIEKAQSGKGARQLTPLMALIAELERRLDIRHGNWLGLLFFKPDYLPEVDYPGHVLVRVEAGDSVLSVGIAHDDFEKAHKVLRIFDRIKHKITRFAAAHCDLTHTEQHGWKVLCRMITDDPIPENAEALIKGHLEAAKLRVVDSLDEACLIATVVPPLWAMQGKLTFYVA